MSAVGDGAAPPGPVATARAEMAPGPYLADRPLQRAWRIWTMMLFGMLFFGFVLFWTTQA